MRSVHEFNVASRCEKTQAERNDKNIILCTHTHCVYTVYYSIYNIYIYISTRSQSTKQTDAASETPQNCLACHLQELRSSIRFFPSFFLNSRAWGLFESRGESGRMSRNLWINTSGVQWRRASLACASDLTQVLQQAMQLNTLYEELSSE